MKGVSSVIAVILILMVVIALGSLSYMFFTGVFQSVSISGEQAISKAATSGQALMRIESVSENQIYIRNIGQVDLTDFAIYIGNAPLGSSNYSIDKSTLSPGDVATITILDAPSGDIRVTTSEGALSIQNNYPGYFDYPPSSGYPWETSPTTYSPGKTYRFNITINDNTGISTVLFQWSTGSNVTVTTYIVHNSTARNYSTTRTDLAGGAYNYKWYANDTSNQWTTWTDSYTVTPATITTSLFLNGTVGDKSYTLDSGANFTVTASVAGKTVRLYTNITGWPSPAQTSTTPLYNYSTLTTAGKYNITGYFAGDVNYSAGVSPNYYATVA